MIKLEKIPKRNALNAAIEGLRSYIIGNKLGPGDRIPTEAELGAALGVSRNIVREAMQYFRAAGIVESKQKVGAVISSFLPENPFESYMPFFARDAQCLKEAAEMRMALECGAAAIMVENCSAKEIARMQELVDALNSEKRFEFDIRFHTILLRMTRNRFIESMIPLTVDFFTRNIATLSDKYYCDLKRISKEHVAIVEAFKRKNPQELEKAFRDHYKSYFYKPHAKEKVS